METLDEQLAKLTIMMERDLEPKPGMGPKKKVGPNPPPKPKKPQPQVPKSYNVNKSCEPSYSTLLQSSSSNGSSYEQQPPPPPAPSHNVYSNITTNNMTLDNPAILEQQKKALEHHKKILEAQNQRKMTPTPPMPEQITNSSTSIYENQKNSQIYSKKPDGLIYSNIIHNSNQNMRRMTDPKPPVNFYSNIPYNSGSSHLDDIPPPAPLDIQVPAGFTDAEDDLPPPPSPVSSSYSELRRATDINGYPPVPTYPPQSDYQPFNQIHQMAHLPTNDPQQVYSNNYQPDYTYGINSQGSSTYESIYEPINPRPPSQLSTRSNYSLYAPYVSGSQTSKMSNQKEAEVDALTDMLVQSLDESPDGDTYGICCKCDQRVVGENSGCTAMDQVYHITCFTCYQCQINLQGKPFYSLDGKPYCEEDYVNTLEKCSVCVKPILERILRATGKPYHPGCFCCVVCGKSLDGIPFTVDATNQIHCIEDFHKKFAPRCCVCRLPIMPEPGKEETVRVVALDRSFHISCYKCEDCGLLLSSEAEGRGCYPLDDHVLCKSCNAKRVQLLTSHMTTEL